MFLCAVVVVSEGNRVTVRDLYDLGLKHSYPARHEVSAVSLCPENHHAFIGTKDGGLLFLASPLVNIKVLEAIASELLNL